MNNSAIEQGQIVADFLKTLPKIVAKEVVNHFESQEDFLSFFGQEVEDVEKTPQQILDLLDRSGYTIFDLLDFYNKE